MRTRLIAILIGLTLIVVGCTNSPGQGVNYQAPAAPAASAGAPAPAATSHAPSYGTGY